MMKVLIINPILYTAETKAIPKVKTIKDTMIYDLCLAFDKAGHDVTLFAADVYKPMINEEYPFQVVWGKCRLVNVFFPNKLPWMPSIKNYLKDNRFDLIISSEVFSFSTYYAYRTQNEALIAWHEIAKHQALLYQLPSKIWYNVVTKYFMKKLHVVARSDKARNFIANYCSNVEGEVIDHGVNMDKFVERVDKERQFVVCSQLIPRKRVEKIIDNFKEFLDGRYPDFKLYIIGSGECENNLKHQTEQYKLTDRVIFTGKLSHDEIIPILGSSMALLVNTEKDNNMISIVESIALGTPILTTEIPLNVAYIKAQQLGIAKNNWNCNDMEQIVLHNKMYVENCLKYREDISTLKVVEKFVRIYNMCQNM